MSADGSVVLVLNAGSSSLKFCVFALRGARLERDLQGQLSGLATRPRLVAKRAGRVVHEREWPEDRPLGHAAALEVLLEFLAQQSSGAQIVGIGHRVVHGGLEYVAPTRVDAEVLARLERYVPLAPLHQPHNLAAIRTLLERRPQVPEIACFDTAFHRSVPEVAQAFALPPRFAAAGVRRYGFHGLSYEYVAGRLPELDARAAGGRTIVLHLGNGASMCALHGGRSVATTMGFTALDGLPMGTRCGAIDPGVLLFLQGQLGMGLEALERLLYQESGLLGLSGLSSDMRELLASDAPAARLAVEVFVYRASREIGSLAAALGGLDALVFTAGIGENQAEIRRRIGESAAWLGCEIDAAANAAHGPRISTPASRVAAWVVPTDEELMIAQHVLRAIASR